MKLRVAVIFYRAATNPPGIRHLWYILLFSMKMFPILLLLLLTSYMLSAQSVPGRLQFATGDEYEITMQTKTTVAQQVNGQAIDFTIDATGVHGYRITNATNDNTTLHHDVRKLSFAFGGMGQKRAFDSDIEKDMNGPFGSTMKDLQSRTYDMIIDSNGQVLMVVPEKFEPARADNRMALINNLLKEALDIADPPAKGSGSFFRVLPAKPSGTGDTWTRSWQTPSGTFNLAYVLTAITDSTIVIDFAGSSSTISKMEMMGQETTTTMNNKSSGKFTLERATGIIREQTVQTDGTGSTETAFGTLPVNTKSSTVVTVKRKNL